MTGLWVSGLIRRRGGRLALTAIGVALCVMMLVSLGSFFAASMRTMTERAVGSVAVDWQVQAKSAGAVSAAMRALRADPATAQALPVPIASVPRLQTTAGGTVQTTGAAKVLGIPGAYTTVFPDAIRVLTGSANGVLLAQQTAANLHASPGDTVRIARPGLTPLSVTVAGVVELPQSDSLFQRVGAPPQSQPVAPPDNVVLLPSTLFDQGFAQVLRDRPDTIEEQIHVQRAQSLPAEPASAYVDETAAARNLEVATSGRATVGDNLGAALDAAREDAAYSRVLFLFLGAPGAILAAALCASIAASGGERRRREFALLRARGARRGQLLGLAAAEAGLVGAVGCVVGVVAAAVVGRVAFGSASFSAPAALVAGWVAVSSVVGLVVATLAVLVPARRDIDAVTVAAGRRVIQPGRRRWWSLLGIDLIVLATSIAVFWNTSQKGYALVLAPEGVPTISVSYWAFLGPGLLWIAVALLSWRVARAALARDGRLLSGAFRGLFGNVGRVVAAALARQSAIAVRSVVLVALAICFAASTATFNATYRQQAEVDAQLTNGADVTVKEPPGAQATASTVDEVRRLPGVRAAEPMLHRYAYVGVDLQDLYGIDPTTIQQTTTLQDPYFQGGTAQQLLARLAARPDAVLVSAETVNDFQLQPGDQLRLRLQQGDTRAYTRVTFHYAGIVNEFPTAPKDSFIVANAAYVAQQTGDPSIGAILIDTSSSDVNAVAANVRAHLGPDASVTTINDSRGLVGSSLTSVDLSGLTRLELAFAFVIVAIAGGLVPALTMAERRRTIAIAAALHASPRQLRAFGLAESLFVSACGLVIGAVAGWALTAMLVKVLTGVFDPPPSSLAAPVGYLALIAVAAGVLSIVAPLAVVARARRGAVSAIRDL